VGLGRKNWIHFGSQEAGPRIAAILSIVESCRRLKIPIRDYLGQTLIFIFNTPINTVLKTDILDMTPKAQSPPTRDNPVATITLYGSSLSRFLKSAAHRRESVHCESLEMRLL
jgi:hypothetical protein